MPKDLFIDGIRVNADSSKTVLEKAQELGISIPTLCNHKALTPFGACRICIVETIWNGKSSLHTACTYPAWDGEVKTNSEVVRKARRMILELMLAEAPEAEDIQKLAQEYEANNKKYAVNRAGQKNKCIMCGLCVRICNDVMKIGAIGFKGRGFQREIVTPFDKYSDVCCTCGACVFVCPTDAIKLEDITDKKITPLLSDFEMRLKTRAVMNRAFPQAIPNKPLIDRDNCIYFNNNNACQICDEVCEFDAIEYEMKDEVMEIEVGNIIAATGFKTFDAKRAEQFGYGKFTNVITSLELERIINASGPTNGNIVLRTEDKNGNKIFSPDNLKPKSVAIIHCVGSRDNNYNKYCSRVCCMYSLKLAHLIKEKLPDAEVYEYYIDMRAFGKGYEEFYERIREEGVHIIRGRTAKIEGNNGKLSIRGEDIVADKLIEQNIDMAILSVGLEPREDAAEISKMLGISQDSNGWFTEANSNSNPVGTITGGITIAGTCQGPKDIPDTVVQASAAAAQVIQSIKKGGYVINELLVTINEIFQKSEVQNVIIAGMGNIGKALSQYKNFKKNNINIVAAFDIDPAKHTKKFGISVYPLNKLTSLIKEYNVNIAIIAVPDIAAQEICNILVINGIKGIMNFSPVVLQVPEDVIVNNINLGNELEGLIYEATFKAK
ncbi:Redox-sensing transcriptional repressor Rex [subsurface metagenome]